MISAAHVHRVEFLAPKSSMYPDINVPILISPSVSPIFMNNPAFSRLDISESGEIKVHSRFLQLQYYLVLGVEIWTKVQPEEYGLNLNNPSSLRSYFSKIHSSSEFGKLIGWEFGFDKFLRTVIIGDIFVPLMIRFGYPKFMIGSLCEMTYYLTSDPGLINCM